MDTPPLRLSVPFFKQEDIYSCGPATLRMVFAHFGIHETERELIASFRMDEEDGLLHDAFVEAVLARGLYCYAHEGATLDEVRFFLARQIPPVVHWREIADEDDHYSVVVGMDDHTIFLNDAWNGECLPLAYDEFKRRWASDNLRGGVRNWLAAISDRPLPEDARQFSARGGRFFEPTGSRSAADRQPAALKEIFGVA